MGSYINLEGHADTQILHMPGGGEGMGWESHSVVGDVWWDTRWDGCPDGRRRVCM